MPLLRAQVVGMQDRQAKDTVKVVVRAGSKFGAIATARLAVIRTIPLRNQELFDVVNTSNTRFFDKWEVEISDIGN